MDFETQINGNFLEYLDSAHLYLVDGVIVPSITQVLKVKFGRKYEMVDKQTLDAAAQAGTAVHEAIQRYCEDGEYTDIPEVKNFRFLQKQYKFSVIKNEVPVILYRDEEPIAAGRLDLVLELNGVRGLADIKRTSTLDKEYLAYQLNLYRIAYQQCYGEKIEFLKGIHLRGETRKFPSIPINEEFAWKLVDEYENAQSD